MSVVLITGCSTGIGRGLARVCAEAGDRVFAPMRNPAKAGDLEELPGVTILALDVTSDESVSKTVDEVLRSVGRIDVLINNAGIDTLGAIEDVSFDRIRAIMETNFFGALKIARAALPAMRAQNSGTIVMVTSMASTFTGYGEGTYAASKRALEAAAEAIQLETARRGIRVHVVRPCYVATATGEPAANVTGETRDAYTGDTKDFYAPVTKAAHRGLAWRKEQDDRQFLADVDPKYEWWVKGEEAPK